MGVMIAPARRRILSGLFVDLDAAWFAAAVLTSNLVPIDRLANLLVLVYVVLGGIAFLIIATVIEEKV